MRFKYQWSLISTNTHITTDKWIIPRSAFDLLYRLMNDSGLLKVIKIQKLILTCNKFMVLAVSRLVIWQWCTRPCFKCAAKSMTVIEWINATRSYDSIEGWAWERSNSLAYRTAQLTSTSDKWASSWLISFRRDVTSDKVRKTTK